MHKRYSCSHTQSLLCYLYAEAACSEVPQRTSKMKFPTSRSINSWFYLHALNALCAKWPNGGEVLPKFIGMLWQEESVCSPAVNHPPPAAIKAGKAEFFSCLRHQRTGSQLLSCELCHKLNKGRSPRPFVLELRRSSDRPPNKLFMLRKSRKVSCPQEKLSQEDELEVSRAKRTSSLAPNLIIIILWYFL